MKLIFSRYFPALLWAAQIYLFSSFSSPIDFLPRFLVRILWRTIIFGQRLFFYMGVVGHFVNFAILAFLLARAFIWKGPLKRKCLILAFSIACLYGVSDEIHQIFIPDRTFQVLDLLINSLGAAFGVFVFSYIHTNYNSIFTDGLKQFWSSLGDKFTKQPPTKLP